MLVFIAAVKDNKFYQLRNEKKKEMTDPAVNKKIRRHV